MEVSRKGSLLEKTLANIFDKAGFDVEVNSREFGFETDVLVKKGNFKIIIEAKQYENSYINIGSLLHEWHSKGKSVDADRVLVVITGVKKINKKFFDLAEELGIYLWGEDTLHELIGIEGNRKLYRQICSYLEFGDVMKRFEKIENSNLSSNQINNLQNQAIALDDLEFQKELAKSIKEKKEKEELIKEQQKIFEENLRKAKKKAKIFKWIKIGLVLAVILFLVLFFYFKFQNIANEDNTASSTNLTENAKVQQQAEPIIQKTPQEELLDFCKLKFKETSSYTELKNSYYFESYSEASNWIENKYPNEGLTINRARFFKEWYLDKAEFPVYILDGVRRLSPQVTSDGLYVCDKNGIVIDPNHWNYEE